MNKALPLFCMRQQCIGKQALKGSHVVTSSPAIPGLLAAVAMRSAGMSCVTECWPMVSCTLSTLRGGECMNTADQKNMTLTERKRVWQIVV